MKKKSTPVIQYICLGALFVAACAYQTRATIATFPGFFNRNAPDRPFLPSYENGQPKAEFVTSNAASAGLHDNDTIIALNGRPFTGLAVFGEAMEHAKAGDTVEVTAASPGSTTPHNIRFALEAAPRVFNVAVAAVAMLKIVLPGFSILLGFWVALVRPRDALAWLLLGVLLGICNIFGADTESWGRVVRDLGEGYRMACNGLWPLFMFLFGLYFPEPFPEGRVRNYAKIAEIVLIPLLLCEALLSVILRIGMIENHGAVVGLDAFMNRYEFVVFITMLIAISSFFASIGMKSGMAVSPDAQRRLKLLYAGTTVALTPTFLLSMGARIKGGELEQVFPEWLVLGSLTLLLVFPITLAYTIVVQRALDVRVVIRQGLQYAFAKGGIRFLQISLIATLVIVLVHFSQEANLNAPLRLGMIAFLAAAIVLVGRGARKVRAWIDRRFFRDAYDAEQVLASLSDEVRSIVDTRQLLQQVSSTIAEALHVPRIAVLLQRDGFYRPAYALGYAPEPDVEIPRNAATIERLRNQPEPARVYFDDEDSWVNSSLPSDERQQLSTLRPQLLLPLAVKDDQLGIMSLGEKRSEEPYSGNDLRLLKSVAAQTGLALANAQLTRTVAEEISRRDKMLRELEIAREVQERLFPQKFPEIPGLDYSGRCRTALGVGGDYYDFLALPEGRLGVALGDVSGKGIAAALMMASLEASLRSGAVRAGGDLAQLIADVNNLVFDASAEDRYATLFYAQYDPIARRLVYVNAGHCAPMVLCKSSTESVRRLDQGGGPVVGLMPDCSYEQAEIALSPGDVVVIYTDGISEAMNPGLEEWGEERLLSAIRDAESSSADDAITQLMHAADAFACGAPQHDDMTLVVLRVV